ncbi:MAG: hypothetical protein HY290_14645 [Planctomycetia bacterium]|nr:hypothetical protein [Planctomycetia bacterium]
MPRFLHHRPTLPFAAAIIALTISPACRAGIITSSTTFAPPAPSSAPATPSAKPNNKPATRPARPSPIAGDLPGTGPIDLTRRTTSSSVFTSDENAQSPAAILGLCLEMTRRSQNGEPNLQAISVSGDLPPANDPLASVTGISRELLLADPWTMSLAGMPELADGQMPGQGMDVLQLALRSLDAGGSATLDALALANFGGPYLPGMPGVAGNGASFGSSFGSNSGSSEAALHALVSQHVARGVASTHSGGSTSPSEPQPLESAGNLLWFLAAALGAYPLLRGRAR